MLNFLKGKGPGSVDFPSDPATMGAPYIQAREFADGRAEFIAWSCHPGLMLDERSTLIPQVIDADGQSFTPQMSSLDSGSEIPRFDTMDAAEKAIRLYSELRARRSVVREDLLSAEIHYLDERLETLRARLPLGSLTDTRQPFTIDEADDSDGEA
jgi:hypothetical protein